MARQIETVNFAALEARAQKMSDASLAYAAKDAREAALIHDEMDRQGMPNNSGRYWDEVSVFSGELAKRRKAAAKG